MGVLCAADIYDMRIWIFYVHSATPMASRVHRCFNGGTWWKTWWTGTLDAFMMDVTDAMGLISLLSLLFDDGNFEKVVLARGGGNIIYFFCVK
jgi:hypothetical protein